VKGARVVWAGFVFNMKHLSANAFFVMTAVIQPVIFATIAFFLFQAGAREGTLLYVALGAGLMGVWSTVLFASGGVLQHMRWQGTLELSIASPPPFVQVLAPMTLANAAVGMYAVLATLIWGRVFFGVPLSIEHPLLFLLALLATVLSLGMLGLVLASSFIRYRHANALSNLLEYPVWLVSGLLIPLTIMPAWAQPISWTLAPTWGVRAVRQAAIGGNAWPEIAMCFGLASVYLFIGVHLLRWFEDLARREATLQLT
jgi:ABC-2 type transport system permease protein